MASHTDLPFRGSRRNTQKLKVAAAQVQTIHDPKKALVVLEAKVRQVAADGVDFILFPEVFIGGFPRLSTFGGSSVGISPSE